MSYPKPLSQKTLNKLYEKAGFSVEVQDYLHKLFTACVNLYGVITVKEIWDLYKRIDTGSLRLRLRDFIEFSAIARREDQPYYVFEINELYSDMTNSERERHIVSKLMIGKGYYRLAMFYRFEENRSELPFFLSNDIFEFVDPKPISEVKQLIGFLNSLRSTKDSIFDGWQKTIPNENKGKRLSQFSFLTQMQRYDLEHCKTEKQRQELLYAFRGNAAEKLVRTYCEELLIDSISKNYMIIDFFNELEEMGVVLTNKQQKILMDSLVDINNKTHLWATRGWRPIDAMKQFPPSPNVKSSISFGPGLRRALEDGSVDEKELLSLLSDMDISIIGKK